MLPPVADMAQDDPAKRPSIDEVVTRFNAMRKKLWTIKLRSRIGRRKEWFSPFRDISHIFMSIKYSRDPPDPHSGSVAIALHGNNIVCRIV
jgi:hypothetical protein